MLVPIDEVMALMMSALRERGFSQGEAAFIVDDYLGAEIEGRRTHGVGRFVVIDRYLNDQAGSPVVVQDGAAVAVVDGNRGIGQLVCRKATSLALTKAKKYGVGTATARNFTRFSRLKVYAEMIAAEGLVGLAVNCGGAPPLVPPPNSATPVVGTNPMAFAFPRVGEMCSFDFATSERAWGHVRQAVLDDTELPPGFISSDGRPTFDPTLAAGVLPVAGGKGFALAFAIEVLSGALAGAKLGSDQNSHLDLGFLVIALNPTAFGIDNETLMSSVRRLTDQVANAPRMSDSGPVPHAPGDLSKSIETVARTQGMLKVSSTVMDKLRQMAAGQAVVDELPKLSSARLHGGDCDGR